MELLTKLNISSVHLFRGPKCATLKLSTGRYCLMTKITGGPQISSCAADFSLLNLPKGKSLGRSKPATNF